MLELRNLEELSLFADTVKDVINYEYEVDGEGGYNVTVADGQIRECVRLLITLMHDAERDDIDPWDNKPYLLAMRLYDEAYYEMCYGDGKLAAAYAEDDEYDYDDYEDEE